MRSSNLIAVAATALTAALAPAATAAGCDPANAFGTATESVGQAPAIGSAVCPGDSLTTGADSLLELRLRDGGVIRLGPQTEIADLQAGGHRLTLLVGEVWAAAPRFAVNTFAVSTGTDEIVGVRGSAFTASRDSTVSPVVFHDIEGNGFVRLGRKIVKFPAGYTSIVGDNSVRLTTRWPAADRAIVPRGQRPARIGSVRFIAGRHGRLTRMRVTLDHAARVIVRVYRSKSAVGKLSQPGHRGVNQLVPLKHRLAPGLYIVTVRAIRGGRVSLVELTVRVR
jgi:hypothetical protein